MGENSKTSLSFIQGQDDETTADRRRRSRARKRARARSRGGWFSAFFPVKKDQGQRAAGAILPGLILRSAHSIARHIHIAKLSETDLGARDAR